MPQFSSISRPTRSPQSLGKSPSPLLLAQWFETLISVQRAAAGSDRFYAETVKAIVDLIGLDRGLVITQTGNGWRVIAEYVGRGGKTGEFSRRIAACVAQQQGTLFQQFPDEQDYSLLHVEAVVAAPVFGRTGDFVGLLYGARQRGRQAPAAFEGGLALGIGGHLAEVVRLALDLLAPSVGTLVFEEWKVRVRLVGRGASASPSSCFAGRRGGDRINGHRVQGDRGEMGALGAGNEPSGGQTAMPKQPRGVKTGVDDFLPKLDVS